MANKRDVYCEDCKHMRTAPETNRVATCRMFPIIATSFVYRAWNYGMCHQKNMKGDCPDFDWKNGGDR